METQPTYILSQSPHWPAMEVVYTTYPAVSSGRHNSMTVLIPSHFGLTVLPYLSALPS
jgi:hypothetical protein